MESELYSVLNNLPAGTPVIPVAPGTLDDFDPSQNTLPCIIYARKNTRYETDFAGVIQVENVTVQVSIYGTTFTESFTIADQARTALQGQTIDGWYFTMEDQQGDNKLPDAIHLFVTAIYCTP